MGLRTDANTSQYKEAFFLWFLGVPGLLWRLDRGPRLRPRRPEDPVRRQQHPRGHRDGRLRRRPRPAAQVVRRRGVRHPHRLDGRDPVRLPEDGHLPPVRPQVPRQLPPRGRSAGRRPRHHHRLHLPQLPLHIGDLGQGRQESPSDDPHNESAIRAECAGARRWGQAATACWWPSSSTTCPARSRPARRGRLQVPAARGPQLPGLRAAEEPRADELHQAADRPAGRDHRHPPRQALHPVARTRSCATTTARARPRAGPAWQYEVHARAATDDTDAGSLQQEGVRASSASRRRT